MIDGMTDVSVKEQELLYVRVVDGGVPYMRFVSLEYLEKAGCQPNLSAESYCSHNRYPDKMESFTDRSGDKVSCE